jgi:hypothetical protein
MPRSLWNSTPGPGWRLRADWRRACVVKTASRRSLSSSPRCVASADPSRQPCSAKRRPPSGR